MSIVTNEAEAVLTVLAKKHAGQTITDEDWRWVFSSEGYTRLKKGELALRRSFEDKDFVALHQKGPAPKRHTGEPNRGDEQ